MASLLSLVAYIAYSWTIITGGTHPNVSSWIVWSFLSLLNFLSYKKLTGGWIKSILPSANSVMTIVIMVAGIKTGSLSILGDTDVICLGIGIIAGLVWWIKKSASFAQILLQIAIVVGFIPTIRNAYIFPGTELWVSWFLWTLSFVLQLLIVKRTSSGKFIEFLYPVNMIVWHGIVFLLAF